MTLRVGDDALSREVAVDVVPASNVDLSTVLSATFTVERPNGTVVEWDVEITNQTSTTVRLTHTLVPGDLPRKGTYAIVANMTTSGRPLRTEPVFEPVKGRFEP